MNYMYRITPNVVAGHTFTVSNQYNFKDSRYLGKGSFGVVATCFNTLTDMTVAVKRIRPYAEDDWYAKHTLREIRILRLLSHHPNIITLYDLSINNEKAELYMFMELMDCDLHRVIQSKQILTTQHHKCFLKQILEGLKAMHSIGIYHRDLKPGNILVSKTCQLRITDFGLARYIDCDRSDGKHNLTEYVVTRWYRAPEILLAPASPYDEAIDIFSVGCIFAELLRRKPLFPGKSHAHQVQLIFSTLGLDSVEELGIELSREAQNFLSKRCIYPKQCITNHVPDLTIEAKYFIEALLSVNPYHRPTANEALHSPYLVNADVFYEYKNIPIVLPDEKDFQFESFPMNVSQLKVMILNEVDLYKHTVSRFESKNESNQMSIDENEFIKEKVSPKKLSHMLQKYSNAQPTLMKDNYSKYAPRDSASINSKKIDMKEMMNKSANKPLIPLISKSKSKDSIMSEVLSKLPLFAKR